MSRSYRCFADYMQDQYYNEMFKAIQNYILKHGRSLDYKTFTVLDPTYFNLEDVKARSVSFHGDDGPNILFRVSVEADVTLRGMGQRDYEADQNTMWFSLTFMGHMLEGLRMVTLVDVDTYSRDRYSKEDSLSKFLVPYLYADDLDKEAEKFLSKYYRDALEAPVPVDLDELIENMCLTKFYAPLPDNIFGKSYFTEADVEVYDDDLMGTHTEHIERGTILINPNVFFMRNVGSVNNTIIHECVHQDRHGKFFEMQKLLMGEDAQISSIACEITDGYTGENDERTKAMRWMEWQANALAPRIQMPRRMALVKIREILTRLHAEFPDQTEAMIMQMAVEEFADFYGATKVAAKVRLVQLGYPQAIGTFVYRDGQYAEPYFFGNYALKKGETFEISERDFHFLFATNSALRDLIYNELFVYVDGMVCIKDEKYVFMHPITGEYLMTPYARNHVDECCLVFQIKNWYGNNEYDDSYYKECFLCNKVEASRFVEALFDPNEKDTQTKADRAKQCKQIKAQAQDIEKNADEMPSSFKGTLQYHMNRLGIDVMGLSIDSDISDVTIGQYLSGQNKRPGKSYVLALCAGLGLQPIYSMDLFRKADHDLMSALTEENTLYMDLIFNHAGEKLKKWNEKLAEWGYKPIPTKNR